MCQSCMLLFACKHATGTGCMQKHIAFCSQKSSAVDELNEKKIHLISIEEKNKQNYVTI